ncbi:MAG: hypothetical protein LBR98_04695 [Syntrophomonadaceae bacterium]|jgi:hypothetical protein|nr:hypothetical protein [Syntrophomonadaceae bacterium]
MAPLLFISAVSAVLIFLLYWILKNPETGDKTYLRNKARNVFWWETGEELVNRLNPRVYLPPDSMKLLNITEKQAVVYWRFSDEKWERLNERANTPSEKYLQLILRLYQVKDWVNTWDITVNEAQGSLNFLLMPETFCYCSIGKKENSKFCPVMTSNTIKKN